MRERGIDYFESRRRATLAQQQYAIRNPNNFTGYSEHCWGITASDEPGPATRRIGGVERRFYDYTARGIPDGPDDGTIAPWASVTSLPFAPEIVLPTIRHVGKAYPHMMSEYGLRCSFNPTFTNGAGDQQSWHSERDPRSCRTIHRSLTATPSSPPSKARDTCRSRRRLVRASAGHWGGCNRMTRGAARLSRPCHLLGSVVSVFARLQ